MHKNIVSWTEAYIKYKDAIRKKVKKMEIDGNKITITNKQGEKEIYLCFDNIDIGASKIKDEKVVCLNTKENLDWLIKNWDVVKTSRNIFIFANPEVSQSWAIHPSMHDVITEKAALKPGLKALFSSIPEVK